MHTIFTDDVPLNEIYYFFPLMNARQRCGIVGIEPTNEKHRKNAAPKNPISHYIHIPCDRLNYVLLPLRSAITVLPKTPYSHEPSEKNNQ